MTGYAPSPPQMPPAPFRAGGIIFTKGNAMPTAPIRAGSDRSLQQQRARAAFWFLVPMLVMLFVVMTDRDTRQS